MSDTIPGGYYIGANGKAHDANGNPIPLRAEDEVTAVETKAPTPEADAPEALGEGTEPAAVAVPAAKANKSNKANKGK